MQTPEQLFTAARKAADEFSTFSRDQVEAIVTHVATKAAERSQQYAEWAVEETGFGDIDSKKIKNDLNCMGVLQLLNFDDYVGYQVDHEKKIVKFAKPAGVVVALVPCTNPVATVYYKAIISLATRNAVILCPHPASKACSVDSAHFIAKLAEEAGAPKGAVQVLEEPSIPVVDQLMKSDQCNLILATGGPAMVRAAYSSSNPAIGVGPGNPAAYVDKTALLPMAAACIVGSMAFDNSLACTSESCVLAHEAIADELLSELDNAGAKICSTEEVDKLRAYLFPEGNIYPGAIGKSAQFICEAAGIDVKEGAKVLVMPFDAINKDEPLSKEKMFPCVGFTRVSGIDAAIDDVQTMLSLMGAGHSAVIHTNDPETAAKYGAALPVCRIAVNAPGVTGSSGFDTNISPGAVIGTGFFGRSSISENVGAKHLVQYTSLAYNKDDAIQMGDIDPALTALKL